MDFKMPTASDALKDISEMGEAALREQMQLAKNNLIRDTIWTSLFGYMAFGLAETHTLMVSNTGDYVKYVPIFDATGDGVTSDVGNRFHLFFLFCFVLYFVQFIFSLLVVISMPLGLGMSFFFKAFKAQANVQRLCMFFVFVLYFLAFVWRFQPSGVIAADDGVTAAGATEATILYFSGLWIFVSAIVMVFVVLITLFALVFGKGGDKVEE